MRIVLRRGRHTASTLTVHKRNESSTQKPPESLLSPAQVAYSHRLGLMHISPRTFRSALSHPALSNSKNAIPNGMTGEAEASVNANPTTETFEDHHEKLTLLGQRILEYFVPEYVKARFPRLPREAHQLACQVYQASSNLSTIARSTGVEYALIPFYGIPLIRHYSMKEYLTKLGGSLHKIPPREIYASVFKATLAAAFQEKGAWMARQFLDQFLFSSTLNRQLLYRPRNPMLQLSRALNYLSLSSPDYRLLHETGRQSDQSLYVVGVYSGVRKLAEAHGPSIVLAQERAALEALRDLYLEDQPHAQRPSDMLGKEGVPILYDLAEMMTWIDGQSKEQTCFE